MNNRYKHNSSGNLILPNVSNGKNNKKRKYKIGNIDSINNLEILFENLIKKENEKSKKKEKIIEELKNEEKSNRFILNEIQKENFIIQNENKQLKNENKQLRNDNEKLNFFLNKEANAKAMEIEKLRKLSIGFMNLKEDYKILEKEKKKLKKKKKKLKKKKEKLKNELKELKKKDKNIINDLKLKIKEKESLNEELNKVCENLSIENRILKRRLNSN